MLITHWGRIADGQGKKTPLQRAASVTLLRVQCESIKTNWDPEPALINQKSLRRERLKTK